MGRARIPSLGRRHRPACLDGSRPLAQFASLHALAAPLTRSLWRVWCGLLPLTLWCGLFALALWAVRWETSQGASAGWRFHGGCAADCRHPTLAAHLCPVVPPLRWPPLQRPRLARPAALQRLVSWHAGASFFLASKASLYNFRGSVVYRACFTTLLHPSPLPCLPAPPPFVPSAGGFGQTSAPAFGATSAPAFGATSAPAFGFGAAASTPAFGASAPAFGAASSASLFGAASTPAFGAAGGTSLFGATQQVCGWRSSVHANARAGGCRPRLPTGPCTTNQHARCRSPCSKSCTHPTPLHTNSDPPTHSPHGSSQ